MGFLQKIGLKNDGRTQKEKEMYKRIEKQALKISTHVLTRKLCDEDINELESLYAEYFKLYPNIEREIESAKRIKKLRMVM